MTAEVLGSRHQLDWDPCELASYVQPNWLNFNQVIFGLTLALRLVIEVICGPVNV